MAVKDLLRPLPGVRRASLLRQQLGFNGSARYWEQHYVGGGTSGGGSYGALGRAKAGFLNEFVREHGVQSVTEFGCGDGHLLSLAAYPRYAGLDVSREAIRMCQRQFADDPAKSFFWYDDSCFTDRAGVFQADLALSLDVVYHLVEDAVFGRYMQHLFAAGGRYVVVYSTDTVIPDTGPHVRHRQFSAWVQENCASWRLAEVTPGPDTDAGPARADFFVFERASAAAADGAPRRPDQAV